MINRNKKLRSAIRIAILMVLVFGIAEVATRLWLTARHSSLENPPIVRWSAYRDSPYWSEAFEQERRTAYKNAKLTDGGFMQGNYHGKWFNFDDSLRRTTDQPQNAPHTIYFVGNSQLEGMLVPDNMTIASYLQQLYNRYFPGKYRVLNLAASGMASSAELVRLKLYTLKQGDIVIFLDGFLDARDAPGSNIVLRRKRVLSGRACNWLSQVFPKLGLAELYCIMSDAVLPRIGQSPEDSTGRELAIQHYQATILAANQYVTAHGAQFYHFLQPNLLSQPLQPEEEAVVNDELQVNPDHRDAIAVNWTGFEQAQHTIARLGVTSWDFTHILDPIRSQHISIYVDLVHVTERGTQALAAAIFDAITTL